MKKTHPLTSFLCVFCQMEPTCTYTIKNSLFIRKYLDWGLENAIIAFFYFTLFFLPYPQFDCYKNHKHPKIIEIYSSYSKLGQVHFYTCPSLCRLRDQTQFIFLLLSLGVEKSHEVLVTLSSLFFHLKSSKSRH